MDNILKISEAASLAMHAAVYLANNPNKAVPVNEIASTLAASEHHLAKVLQRLARANLITSVRGPKGGYTLNRPAKQIPLLEVYEAIEGKIATSECLLASKVCKGDTCILGPLIHSVNRDLLAYLEKTLLTDLISIYQAEGRVEK